MNQTKGLKETYYPECEFGGYSRVDGTVAFFGRVQALARPDMVVLDVGCGRGNAAERLESNPWEKCRLLKGRCKHVIGIDVGPAGQGNPLIDEFRRIEGDTWPVETASVDLLVSDAVLEHVEKPEIFFAECSRVLKPGGYLCLRTPNRWSYVSMVASVVPNAFHAKVVSWVQPGRQALDVFPTYYRANTKRAVRRLLRDHGFSGYVYPHIAEPGYFGFSRQLYGVVAYVHRWLPSIFWPVLFVFARRLADDGGAGGAIRSS
jgi:SAM-dependent methyltransferase